MRHIGGSLADKRASYYKLSYRAGAYIQLEHRRGKRTVSRQEMSGSSAEVLVVISDLQVSTKVLCGDLTARQNVTLEARIVI